MINDYPNLRNQEPGSQKLVLPGQTKENYQPGVYTQRVPVHPDQLRPQVSSTSTNPLSRLAALWRADPAYKVLMIATAMVLIAGIVFATFLINAFAQPSTSTISTPKAAVATAKTASAPKTPANLPPTFPTPSGGQGSQQSNSQPPKSAPVVLPTLTPSNANTQPVQQTQNQNQNQNLQLQITAFPQQVSNNSDVQVTVMANQPGVSVHLQASFDNSIITNTSDVQETAGDGTASLNWHVANVSFRKFFMAHITAYATDQNGQQVASQTVSVEVSNRFNFNP